MANVGRTNEKFTKILIYNAAASLIDLSSYCKSINGYGLKFNEQDVTGLSDAIKNITIGRPEAPITIVWQFDTVIFTQLIALLNRMTPLSLDIRIGIGHAWVTGEPVFGITSSATSGYVLRDMLCGNNSVDITTVWNVVGGIAPAFGTTANT